MKNKAIKVGISIVLIVILAFATTNTISYGNSNNFLIVEVYNRAYYKKTQDSNKLATPIITINPEGSTNEVTVIIEKGLEEDIDKPLNNSIVKYHIDRGGGEEIEWVIYTQPFTVAENAIIRAIAMDLEGSMSEEAIKEIANIKITQLSDLKYDDGHRKQTVIMQKGIREVKFNFNINTVINNLDFVLNLNTEDKFELDTVSAFKNYIDFIKEDENITEIDNILIFDENNNFTIKLFNEIQPGDYSIGIPLKVDNKNINETMTFNLDIVRFKVNGVETRLEEPVRILIQVVKLPKLL